MLGGDPFEGQMLCWLEGYWQALLEFCDKDVFEVTGGPGWVAMLPLGADVEPVLVLTIDEFDPANAGFFAQLTHGGLCRGFTGIEAAGD